MLMGCFVGSLWVFWSAFVVQLAAMERITSVPCGETPVYDLADITNASQFVIRSCPGVASNGSYAGTVLTLELNHSTLLPPVNISVLVEHSVSVTVVVLGGNASVVDFTLVMTNVTNPATPLPLGLRCVNASVQQDVWCGPMVQLSGVTLVGARLTLSNVSYLRGEDSVLQVLLSASSSDVVINARDVVHTGILPILYLGGVEQNATMAQLSIALTQVTVRASGVVPTKSMYSSLVWLDALVLANVDLLVGSVAVVDVGVSGPGELASIAVTSVLAHNVTLLYTDASHTLATAAAFFMLSVSSSVVGASQLLLRNVTASGQTTTEFVALVVQASMFSGVTVAAVEDSAMSGATVSAFRCADSLVTSNMTVRVSDVYIQVINAGTLVRLVVRDAPFELREAIVVIRDSQAVGNLLATSPSLYILFCAGVLLRNVQTLITNVSTQGAGGGVYMADCPGTAVNVRLIVAQCSLRSANPIFLHNTHHTGLMVVKHNLRSAKRFRVCIE